MNDVATVTPSGATGAVSFKYYDSLEDCEADTGGTAAGTSIAVSGGTATSSTVQFNTAGTFYWSAWFTGSGTFDDSSSLCEEWVTVTLNVPDLATQPWVIPQDDATLGSLLGATPGGTLTFELWDSATCDGTMVYSEVVTVTGNDTYSTSNSGDSGSGGFAITSDGTFYWIVKYSGDSQNSAVESDRGDEIVEVDLTPDPAP